MINSQSNFSSFSSRYVIPTNPDIIEKSVASYQPKCMPVEKRATSEQSFFKRYDEEKTNFPHGFKNYSSDIVNFLVE